jgi:CheY-like chemotaxis protein
MALVRPTSSSSRDYETNRNHSCPIDVLIADDEAIVRRVLDMALCSAGLRVKTAVDGAEVMRLYREHPGGFGVILLDIHMPELDGPQTFAALRQIDPDVRVLFMSGGSTEYDVDDLLARGAIGFVQKPFRDLDEVVDRLCRLVTNPAQAG